MARPNQSADLLGIACSAGCAVHCAAMPVVATAAPSLGFAWLAGSLVHQVAAIMCGVFVYKAIVPAWRRHRDRVVIGCVAGGLVLLMLAAFVLPDPCCEPTSVFGWFGLPLLTVTQLQWLLGSGSANVLLMVQPYLTPIGGILLIVAHVMNLDLVRRESRGMCKSTGCLQTSSC